MGRAARWLRGLLGVGGGKNKKKNTNTIAAGLAGDGTKQNVISRPRIGNSSHRREETRNGSENKNSIGSPVGLLKSTVRVVGNEDEDGNVMNGWRRRIECFAAVKIQSFFRGYLARKARRALRAIVKLQAVVRGYLVRKQLARTLNTMQALFNAWSQHCTNASPATYRNPMQLKLLCDETKTQTVYTDAVSTSFNGTITTTTDSPPVGEVNSSVSKSSNYRFSSCTFSSEDRSCNIPPPIKVRAQRSVRECEHRSSSFHHASHEIQSARLVKTPRRSDCTPLGSPNYMLCTKSFMAKIKSQNSPRQRFESRRRAFEAEMGIHAR